MDWGTIIAGAVGVLSTLVKTWLDKRSATRSQIETWAKNAFWIVDGLMASGVLPDKFVAYGRYLELVHDFAESAGMKVGRAGEATLRDIFDERIELATKQNFDRELAKVLDASDKLKGSIKRIEAAGRQSDKLRGALGL